VPLLVVRLRDLERVAWREGRAAARALERRSIRSFVATATRTLRASDLLSHDAESEDFIAALISPTRGAGSVATPSDCRATLARLASAMELGDGMRVETGWTILHGVSGRDGLAAAVEAALERGARERERYAFFSTIGHELRTPLTSIRGYLETLMEEELDAHTARRFLTVARNEATRLSRLVDALFDLSMLDLRSGSQPGESTMLLATVGAAIATVTPFAAGRRATIALHPCDDVDVAAGNDTLVQIVVNVVENAVKHGADGGRVSVSCHPLDEQYIELRVDDDGPGVPLAEREAIFTLASRGTNSRAKGSGIGLAVVRLMLERIGGSVEVGTSDLGGAQFRLRLPRASRRESPVAVEMLPTDTGSTVG